MKGRPCIEAKQSEDGKTARNDRLLARAAHSWLFAEVSNIADLGASFSDELGSFFTAYNALDGKSFEVLSVGDAARTVDLGAKNAQSARAAILACGPGQAGRLAVHTDAEDRAT